MTHSAYFIWCSVLWPRHDLILLEGFQLKDDTNFFLTMMSLTFAKHGLFYRIYKIGFKCNPVPLLDPDPDC